MNFGIKSRIASFCFLKTLIITTSLSIATPPAVAQTLIESLSDSELSRLVEPEVLQDVLSQRDIVRIVVEFDRPFDQVTAAQSMETLEGMEQITNSIRAIQDRILMRSLQPAANQSDTTETEHQLGVVRLRTSPMMALNADAALIQRLSRDPDVVRIHIDHELQENMNETLPLIGMPEAYASGATGAGQAVVVIDSGIWGNHEFLQGKVVSEACFNESAVNSGRASFCPGGAATSTATGSACTFRAGQNCNHGTHVAGTVAGFNADPASGVPASGVARNGNVIGINYSSCSSGDATSCSGTIGGFSSDAVAALEYILTNLRFQHEIAAVNISQGIRDSSATSPCQTSLPAAVIADLRAVGIATVVSAGNSGFDNAVGQPYACITEAIAVASTTKTDQRSWFSNWGSLVDLAAPGSSIQSSIASASDAYAFYNGTSMAAPHVAGAFAAIRSARPDASVDAILAALQQTGTGVTDVNRTHPRINVDAALEALDGVAPTTTTLSGPPSSIAGESFTLTAQVNSSSGTPSGNVQFSVNGSDGALRSLNSSGVAEWQVNTAGTPPGTYTFTAQYMGGSGFGGSSASLSHVIVPDLPAPPNDLFANRITISGPGTYTGTTVGATSEPGQPTISASNSTNAIWWSYTATANGLANVDLCDSDYDTTLAVFTGASVTNLSPVVSDNAACGLRAEVQFVTTAGTEYQIGVGGWNNATGNVVLNLAFDPDLISTSTNVTGPSSATLGDVVTFNASVTAASGTAAGMVSFRRNGEQFATASVNANGNASVSTTTIPSGTHQITAHYLGNETFSSSNSTPITLTVTAPLPPPPNDLFADRITIPGPGTYTGTTVGATSEPGQPSISASNSTNAIWWRYTAPASGTVNIDLCDSDYDTTLAVFTGSTLSNLSQVASDDVGCNLRAEVEFQAAAGTEYQIGVGGWNNQTGNVVLNLAFEAGEIATETTLSAPASGILGENLTFSANVSAESGTPAGWVSFRRNGVQFASSALDTQGSATTVFNDTPEGTHEITAHYLGNDDFEASASAGSTLTITLSEIATTIHLDTPAQALVDDPIVLQATVSGAAAVPTGNVRFWRDDIWIATVSMDIEGVAILGEGGWLTLPEGMHQIRAEYLGNGSFQTSMSESQTVLIASSEMQITQLAVGGRHACGLTFGGAVYCWGANDSGQLGDRSTESRHRARAVRGLRHPAITISAGLDHTCALLEDRRISCWGDNSHGQLGRDNVGDFSTSPVLVRRSRDSIDISTPGNSSCLIDSGGGMQCWGANSSGQLGNNSTADEDTPRRVRRLARGDTTLGTGGMGAQNCALNEIGRVFCWGENAFGQVGDGSQANRTIPTRVELPRARNWRTVAMGEQHSCATDRAGRAFCWGRNSSGELGDGTLQTRLTPVSVEGLGRNVQALALGTGFSCALDRGRLAYCWGANTDGRLGARLAPDVIASEPVRVRRLGRGVRQIAAGATSACAIDTVGEVYCWGGNDAGQLGQRPQRNFSDVPLLMDSLP